MSRKLFLKIVYALRDYDSYFRCKLDCTGMAGFSALQKFMVAMRMLAYGAPGDSTDDYLQMAESTDCYWWRGKWPASWETPREGLMNIAASFSLSKKPRLSIQ
jgi:hypothetical protein